MENIVAELDCQLYRFLIREGYSHVLSSGFINDSSYTDSNYNDFLIIPLQMNDKRLKNCSVYETKCIHIASAEVLDMSLGTADPIRFLVQLHIDKYLQYLSE